MRKIAAKDREAWKLRRRQQTRAWAAVQVEHTKVYQRLYRQRNKAKLAAQKHDRRKRVRVEGLAAYGGKCTCCGEDQVEFLTFDHVNGRNKREKRVTGYKAWYVAKRLGYPPEFTVLCFNCNCAKGIYGKCPHQRKKNEHA
jgi:hypothetical protein